MDGSDITTQGRIIPCQLTVKEQLPARQER